MPHRPEQMSDALHAELAQLVNREVVIPNSLITITEVRLSPDLARAQIFISVLPDKFFGTALRELRKHSGELAKTIGKRLKWYKMPHFVWAIDSTEKEAAALEEVFKQL